MTDEPENPLTPAQEEQVRRLLGEARHDEPMPPDVATRMDRVLDDLADEPGRVAPVTQLATRRRRVTSLLVAAAAVVVVGVGIGQVIGAGTSEDGDSSTSAESAADSDAGGSVADAEEDPNGGGQSGQDETDSGDYAAAPQTLGGKVFKLDPDELSRDIHRVQRYALTSESASDANLNSPWPTNLAKCATKSQGTGTFVPVRYGGRPGVVAFRTPAGDTQVAEVYLCGGAEPVRSLTLRIP